MNINIRIDEEKNVEVSRESSGVSPQSDQELVSGGAPNMGGLSLGEANESAAPGMEDIGGPPAWLFEQIKLKDSAASSPNAESDAEENDAGGAPEFN